MTNTQLLDEKIEKSGLKINFICEQIGISRQRFHDKKTNKAKFRQSEIYVLCDLLNLEDKEEKIAIFFAKEVG